MTAARYY